MKPIQVFNVVPSLPSELEALRTIAYNLRWAWNHESVELFRRLDRELWETTNHNPVLMLGAIEQQRLEEAAEDEAFLAHMRRVEADLESYMSDERHWFRKHCGNRPGGQPSIAYFSAEFGITECLSIFAGGLGMLAGDHLKSASDLGLPLTGVGLLYQQGYFRQYLNQAGWQQEAYEENDFHNLPISPACDPAGAPVVISVDLPDHPVYAQVWRAQVGRIPLYLLDTNFDRNSRPEDRHLTDALYGGDRETRIRQEILLGIGGYRALEALGIVPTVFHMNEGHSAFLAVEHIRRLMETRQLSFDEARVLASAGLVFTTHTPVEAGHDYFGPELIERYFHRFTGGLHISWNDFMELGRSVPGQGEFCMTVLALRLATQANGVSKLHGEVSRRMWRVLWPGVPEDEIPIRHVTNGVHFCSWTSLEMNQLYDRYLGPSWREDLANGDVWPRVSSIPAEELWRTHERRRDRMVAWARTRVRNQRIRRSSPPSEIEAADEILDPDALTIGFARRFATYKRATLILRNMDRLIKILTHPQHPVQIIFAGKAHPRDEAGKELIRQLSLVTRHKELGRRVVFLEDYDMTVARYLVQGVDVWLNNPLRPNEASGTSGMKAAANGVLNLSTLDGWWDEVWRDPENPQTIGWAIGKGEQYQDTEYQNQLEADALYDLLERDVVPTFYDRGADRIPRKWIARMKSSVGSLCKFVNTHRMVGDYMCGYYFRADGQFRAVDENHAARARALASWLARVRSEWQRVRIENVKKDSGAALLVGANLHVQARIHLAGLSPADVAVELYVGRLNPSTELIDPATERMVSKTDLGNGTWIFEASACCASSGMHGFTVRVRPSHADLFTPFVPGLITWADA